MYKIPENLYRQAVKNIFQNYNWIIDQIDRSIYLASKNGKKIIFRNCGKILPQEVIIDSVFETWIHEKNLYELESLASERNIQEAFIIYSYAILAADNFSKYFDDIEIVNGIKFGCKAVKLSCFKEMQKERSVKWKAVSLPRYKTIDIFQNISQL